MAELGSGAGTSYPAFLDTDNVKEVNFPSPGFTYVTAEKYNDLAEAIIAIQNAVGVSPMGSLTDLVSRLAVSLKEDGTLQEGIVRNIHFSSASTDRLAKEKQIHTDMINHFLMDNPILLASGINQSNIPWTVLNLTDETSESADGVSLLLSIKDSSGQAELKVRKGGSTEDYLIPKVRTQTVKIWNDLSCEVALDGNQDIEYSLSASGESTASFEIKLLSYRESVEG